MLHSQLGLKKLSDLAPISELMKISDMHAYLKDIVPLVNSMESDPRMPSPHNVEVAR